VSSVETICRLFPRSSCPRSANGPFCTRGDARRGAGRGPGASERVLRGRTMRGMAPVLDPTNSASLIGRSPQAEAAELHDSRRTIAPFRGTYLCGGCASVQVLMMNPASNQLRLCALRQNPAFGLSLFPGDGLVKRISSWPSLFALSSSFCCILAISALC
jgi:hypothetical protein